MTKAKKSKRVEAAETQPSLSMLFILRVILLCTIAFLTPLVAGRLVPFQDISIQLAVLVTAVIWLADARKNGILSLPGGRSSIYAAVFMGLLLLSSIGTLYLHATLRELLNVFCYLLIFCMAADLRGKPKAIYAIIGALLLSALVVGALGVREYRLTQQAGWRVFSTFYNPDFTAGFLALVLPLAIAWYLSATSFGVTAATFLSILFISGCLVMTGSRFGFGGAAVGVLAFFATALLSKSIRRAQFLRLAVLFLPALAMCIVLGKPLMNRMASKSVHDEWHSMAFRTYTWQGTMRMAKANPIKGTGLGTFEVAYPPYGIVAYTRMAHNSYFQISGEAGPAAAAVLILLIGSAAIPSAASLLRRKREVVVTDSGEEFSWMPSPGLLASGMLGGIAASAARNLVDSDWYVCAIGLAFWMVLGLFVSMEHPKEGRRIVFSMPHFSVLAGVLALVFAGSVSMLLGALHASDAETFASEGDLQSAISSYEQACSADRLDSEPHLCMGEVRMAMAHGSGDRSYAERAVEDFREAVRLNPGSSKNHYQLYKAYDFLGRNDEALAAVRKAVSRDPQSPVPLEAMARLYGKMGRQEEMLSIYRTMAMIEQSPYEKVRAVTELVEPNYVFAHVALGDERLKDGDEAGAKQEYLKAMDRIERYQESMKAMGAVLAAGGRQDQAMEDRIERVKKELRGKLK